MNLDSRIYESFTFWNELQKKELFHDILIFEMHLYIFYYSNIKLYLIIY